MSGSVKPQQDFSLKATTPKIAGRPDCTNRLPTYDLVEKMELLYVRIVKARDLVFNTDPPHPFVQVTVGNSSGATMVREKEPNPEWNQVFAFFKEKIEGNEVDIRVMDKDEVVGRFVQKYKEAPVRVPPDSPLAPDWKTLVDANGRRVRGELMVAVWMGTQADEAFSEASHSDAASAATGEGLMSTRSKVYLQPRLAYLRINVIEARDLVLGDRRGKMPEVFVCASLGHLVLRTNASPNRTHNPAWNKDLMFVASAPFDEPLVLTVQDSCGPNQGQCLGRCIVPLQQVFHRSQPGPVEAHWYNLERVLPEGADQPDPDVPFPSKLHARISLDVGYHVLDESTHNSSDYRPTDPNLWAPPIGVLELGILNAKDLLPMKRRDNRGATDAYCVAKYGPKWIRTRTIVDSFSPKWNEQYTWDVYDPCTVITIGVFDNCHLQGGNREAGLRDSTIGKVRIRLSALHTDKVYTHSYPLVVIQPTGVRKMGEIQLAIRYRMTETSIFHSLMNMLSTYGTPILPLMHYATPLSIHQLESLRHQATQVLAMRMSRTEPPLEREVVEYMLDAGSHMWSMRKSQANLARIKAIFSGTVTAWKFFESVRLWKSPVTTVLVLFMYTMLVFFSELILPTIFGYLVIAAVMGFRGRPIHPPHMDIKLSCADSVTTDDLDEEFDTFPSSKTGKTLTMRYDRLRSISTRVQSIIGDLASQAERLHSMISWRDPRATFIFVLICIIGAMGSYLVPFRYLAVGVGFYVLRHPRFRVPLPCWPQNYLRRLPAKTDCIF